METGRKRRINPDRKYYEYKENEEEEIKLAPAPDKKVSTQKFREQIPTRFNSSARSDRMNAEPDYEEEYIGRSNNRRKEYEDYEPDFGNYEDNELEEISYEGEEIWKEEKKKKSYENNVMIEVIGLAIIAVIALIIFLYAKSTSPKANEGANSGIQNSGQANQSSGDNSEGQKQESVTGDEKTEYISKHPELYDSKLTDALSKNPELIDFVYNYPNESHKEKEIDLTAEANAGALPTLMQWDERWGYKEYTGNVFGLSGCGPTCLSMVALYLTKNASYTPAYVADYAVEKGFCTEGEGTTWSLMSESAADYGLTCAEVPADEKAMKALATCKVPIICIMAPGDFTDAGHYIVISGYENGAFKVHDPYRQENSDKTWSYETLQGQISNMWAYWGPTLSEASYSVNGSEVNVRKEPNQSGEVVRKANSGETLKIKSIKKDGSLIWGEIEDGSWICMNFVTR